jgi:hypothetical protein
VPKANAPKSRVGEAEIVPVERIDEAVRVLREL